MSCHVGRPPSLKPWRTQFSVLQFSLFVCFHFDQPPCIRRQLGSTGWCLRTSSSRYSPSFQGCGEHDDRPHLNHCIVNAQMVHIYIYIRIMVLYQDLLVVSKQATRLSTVAHLFCWKVFIQTDATAIQTGTRALPKSVPCLYPSHKNNSM